MIDAPPYDILYSDPAPIVISALPGTTGAAGAVLGSGLLGAIKKSKSERHPFKLSFNGPSYQHKTKNIYKQGIPRQHDLLIDTTKTKRTSEDSKQPLFSESCNVEYSNGGFHISLDNKLSPKPICKNLITVAVSFWSMVKLVQLH